MIVIYHQSARDRRYIRVTTLHVRCSAQTAMKRADLPESTSQYFVDERRHIFHPLDPLGRRPLWVHHDIEDAHVAMKDLAPRRNCSVYC